MPEINSRSERRNALSHYIRNARARWQPKRSSRSPKERRSSGDIYCVRNNQGFFCTLLPQELQKDRVDFFGLFVVRDMSTIFNYMKFKVRHYSAQVVTMFEGHSRVIASPE